MKTYLYFYRGHGIPGWVIRHWTKSNFAHVSPVIVADNLQGVVYDAFWGQKLSKRLLTIEDSAATRVELVHLDIPGKLLWLEAQLGKRYDRLAIFLDGIAKWFPSYLHVSDSLENALDCSRLSCDFANLEEEAEMLSWPVTPGDLYRLLTSLPK